ncbi:MAG: response regulator [Planctomycetes bacterium]|nr:response regulator [Planctomycetota bacterium]
MPASRADASRGGAANLVSPPQGTYTVVGRYPVAGFLATVARSAAPTNDTWNNAVSRPIASPGNTHANRDQTSALSKVLYLGGTHDTVEDIRSRLGDDVEVVEVSSPVKALSLLTQGKFSAIYCDADHFSRATDVVKLIRNDRILQGVPDGVVLLDQDNLILWGNGRLSEWCGRDDVVGENFYQMLGSPEILGPDFCPFHTALATGAASTSMLRCADNRYYRIHAAPIIESGDKIPQNLVVTVHDISEEVLQQQKLEAIHQAGGDLADLTTDEIASLTVEERIELLKSNILQCTQDILKLDVVEIRMLNPETGFLDPIMAVGMAPGAIERELSAETEGSGVTGFVAATGKSYICEHTTEDPLYLQGAEGARSSLTVPLILHEQVIGTLNVESPEANAFTDSDLQFLEIFARNVAVALNTLELLVAEKASTAAASVEAIHSAVALPVDDILNDAVNVMERYIGHEPEVVERLQSILRNARDIKRVIQKVGQKMTPTQAQPSSVVAESRPLLAGKRILVVDADESVRTAAHALLERFHCIVETAHDGNEARFMIRNLGADSAYDVIIADIRLPDMNGYELLLKLAELMKHVPMVLMTGFGYDPGHSIVKARQEGVKNVLYKPFRLDQLVSAIEDTISANVAE